MGTGYRYRSSKRAPLGNSIQGLSLVAPHTERRLRPHQSRSSGAVEVMHMIHLKVFACTDRGPSRINSSEIPPIKIVILELVAIAPK